MISDLKVGPFYIERLSTAVEGGATFLKGQKLVLKNSRETFHKKYQ